MPLTKSFQETVVARARDDRAFRTGMLVEAIDLFLHGELATGKSLLRDYINATIGFPRLAETLGKNPKSLMRMLSDGGNPRADSIFAIIAHLQRYEGLSVTVQAAPYEAGIAAQ